MKGNPTYAEIIDAMSSFDTDRMPQSFADSKFYHLVHPTTQVTYPPKAIWGIATGLNSSDFDAPSAKRWLKKKGFYIYDTRLETTQIRFDEQIKKSQAESVQSRLARLAKAPKKPKPYLALVRKFARNSDVVAQRLHMANGVCENCSNPAPFHKKKDGRPYLEVHHAIPLADGGDDTVENSLALCPNCHREAHFG